MITALDELTDEATVARMDLRSYISVRGGILRNQQLKDTFCRHMISMMGPKGQCEFSGLALAQRTVALAPPDVAACVLLVHMPDSCPQTPDSPYACPASGTAATVPDTSC